MILDRLSATAPSWHCRCPRGAGGVPGAPSHGAKTPGAAWQGGRAPGSLSLPAPREAGEGEPQAAGGEMEREDKKEMAWSKQGWQGRESSARVPGSCPAGPRRGAAPGLLRERCPRSQPVAHVGLPPGCLTRRGAVQPCCSCPTDRGNWSQLKPLADAGAWWHTRGLALGCTEGASHKHGCENRLLLVLA